MTRALLILALALWAGALARDRVDLWIDRTDLPPLLLETSAEVRDRNGDLLRVYTVADGRWRLRVSGVATGCDAAHPATTHSDAPRDGDRASRPTAATRAGPCPVHDKPGSGHTGSAIDPLYLRMLFAYEDQRFLTHSGVDLRAMARAAWTSLRAGRITSGGSTLTMQTARLLEASGTGAWRGKLRQIRVALALERQLDKAQILDLYLHLAPMGGNLEGLRAATLSYFGKEPRRLTPAEAALLVALPQSPEARRPDRHPIEARAARDRVLIRMIRQGVLTEAEARVAATDTAPRTRRAFPALAPHLTDRALHAAPDAPTQTLTLDATLQAQLEDLARRTLRGRSDRISVAIVAADHRSGEILASVGSGGMTDRGQGFVDMTQALRSPGSTLKPLIYGLAFDQGLAHPETLIADRPMDFDGYAPQNFDGHFRGEVRVADALRLSLNLPAVQLTEAIGPQNLMAALRRAGTQPDLTGTPGLAVALGGLGMTLTDLTQLYASLANGGMTRPLHWRAQEHLDQPRLMSRASAWQVGHILAGLAPPPGAPANRLAYKTGTSYGHRDAWAIGFDGAHVIGVWMGRPDGTPVPGAFGGDLAAPVLFEAFGRLKPTLDAPPPPPPETLLVGAALLPEPLKRFRSRTGLDDTDRPQVAFPPDGAVLAVGAALPAKVRDGVAPFTWLANGHPVRTAERGREVLLDGLGRGFTELSVIDGAGRSARVEVVLE
ncbi:penicillin-binding protein 1C [Pseudooceanicola onchidii]|uniref:penicillin-binding protein 1C n=1 Tax=Pseudooceanicola onchidii TaxID=2562279 RepID=UPI0010A9B75F|nr:penicillin-binding protein 1C [Pseudooceanicola onchidii]